MTLQTLTTIDDYNLAPLGVVALDERGYAWQKTGHIQTLAGVQSVWITCWPDDMGEQREFTAENMAAGGTRQVVHVPANGEAKNLWREYTTPDEIAELAQQHPGAIIQDRDGDKFLRVEGGWVMVEESILSPLNPDYAPYRIVQASQQRHSDNA